MSFNFIAAITICSDFGVQKNKVCHCFHCFYIYLRWRSSTQSAKPRLGTDCGSEHELLIAKFRLKLKKVGKTTRPFRYDLNQISYDYTVEVRNRCKGLDRVPDELWAEVHDPVRETGSKTIPLRKRNAKRQNTCLRKPYKEGYEKKRSEKQRR